MPRRCPPFAVVLLLALPCAAPLAHAGALYRCDASDGSIAYTSSPKGFSNCKLLQHFADSAPKKPAPVRIESHRWVYEEGSAEKPPAADFSKVVAAAAVQPAAIARASFARVAGGVASSAPVYVAEDFSTVQADVASSAALVGNPLFIAAPYRPRPAPAQPVRPALALAAASASPATRVLRGAVYRVQRKNGITEYTNIKPNAGAFAVLFTYIATCVACDLHSKIDFARTALNLDAYKAEIAAAAADFGVDGALLRAVIHAESAFNPMAVSNKGAQGLMQLMPGTATDLGVTDAFDVAQNIRGGARYLAQLLKNFNGDAQLATAAYNAGPGAVQRYRGVPPYDETQVYVQRVTTLRDRYQKAM